MLTGLSALLQTARKSRLTSWGGNSASSCFDDAVSIAGDESIRFAVPTGLPHVTTASAAESW